MQDSSDEHFDDYDDDEEEDDEDWQEVDTNTGFTVTVDANPEAGASTSRGFYQEVQAEDGRSVQIEAPSLLIQAMPENMEQDVEDLGKKIILLIRGLVIRGNPYSRFSLSATKLSNLEAKTSNSRGFFFGTKIKET